MLLSAVAARFYDEATPLVAACIVLNNRRVGLIAHMCWRLLRTLNHDMAETRVFFV